MVDRHVRDPPLLPSGDGRGGAAELAARARFHLDEDDPAAIASDDVNFSVACAVAARQNCVPASDQFSTREILAQFSEVLPWVGGHTTGSGIPRANHSSQKVECSGARPLPPVARSGPKSSNRR